MKAWRSLRRALLDIRILVCNLGRVDFRRKHLAAYALECQTSLNLLPGDAAYACSQNMLAAVGVFGRDAGYCAYDEWIMFWPRVRAERTARCHKGARRRALATEKSGHGLVGHLQNAAFASMLEIFSEFVNPAPRNPFRREFPWCQAERRCLLGARQHPSRWWVRRPTVR